MVVRLREIEIKQAILRSVRLPFIPEREIKDKGKNKYMDLTSFKTPKSALELLPNRFIPCDFLI